MVLPVLEVGCASFVAGAGVAAAAVVKWFNEKQKYAPTKVTHPRQWSVFSRVDVQRRGSVSRDAIRSLCYRFDAEEHADCLVDILDPHGLDHITFEMFCDKYKHVLAIRNAARLKVWHRCCGIGVAGNVAGHMAQAGEAGAESHTATMPAGLFVYYAPPHAFEVHCDRCDKKRLEQFPVTYAVIDYPKLPGSSKVQVEPELGLYVDIVYSEDRTKVLRLVPRRVAAFNDCSIRVLDGASKLSQKKNWGFGSKGISLRSFPIDSFSPGSFVDNLASVSFVKRDDETHKYSVNAPAKNYLLFHEPLLEWIVERINNQVDSASFEPIWPKLVESDLPSSSWIALGAGKYTEWGEQNYIKPKDETVILIYDMREFPEGPDSEMVEAMFQDRLAPKGIVCLHQTFVA